MSFCRDRGLNFDAVNDNLPEIKQSCGDRRKIIADIYIDDRAMHAGPNVGRRLTAALMPWVLLASQIPPHVPPFSLAHLHAATGSQPPSPQGAGASLLG